VRKEKISFAFRQEEKKEKGRGASHIGGGTGDPKKKNREKGTSLDITSF